MSLRVNDARRFATVTPALGAAYLKVCQLFAAAFSGCFLGLSQGFRTPSAQTLLAARGLSKADGITTFSYHQLFPSLALDFVVLDATAPDGWIADGSDARYRWVGNEFKKLGFKWGGDFPDPDWDHVEVDTTVPDAAAVEAAYSEWTRAVENAPFLGIGV